MKLQEFNSKYKYKSDSEKFILPDVWEIIEPSNDGFYYGDCESYCRTLKDKVDGFKDWDYYYCKLNGEGHCSLVKDEMVIDCNIRKEISIDEYHRFFKVTEFKKYNILLVWLKIAFSGVLKRLKR